MAGRARAMLTGIIALVVAFGWFAVLWFLLRRTVRLFVRLALFAIIVTMAVVGAVWWWQGSTRAPVPPQARRPDASRRSTVPR